MCVVLCYLCQKLGLPAPAPPAARPNWISERPGPKDLFLRSKKQTKLNNSHLLKYASAPLTYGCYLKS